MLDSRCRRKILGGPAVTHLMIAVGLYLLLLALIIVSNINSHRKD